MVIIICRTDGSKRASSTCYPRAMDGNRDGAVGGESEAPTRKLQPVGHREQLLTYIAMAGELFAVILEGAHYEPDTQPGGSLPNDALPVILFQLQLCTLCIMKGELQPAKAVLDLASAKKFMAMESQAAMDELQAMFPTHTQQDAVTHGKSLLAIHGNYLRDRGYDMVAIRTALGLSATEEEKEKEP